MDSLVPGLPGCHFWILSLSATSWAISNFLGHVWFVFGVGFEKWQQLHPTLSTWDQTDSICNLKKYWISEKQNNLSGVCRLWHIIDPWIQMTPGLLACCIYVSVSVNCYYLVSVPEKIIVGPHGVPDPPSLAQMTFTQCTSMSELKFDSEAPPGGQI